MISTLDLETAVTVRDLGINTLAPHPDLDTITPLQEPKVSPIILSPGHRFVGPALM